MSVRWKEDSNGEPYTIIRAIGPVNYAVQNCKKTQKVYHRNMLRKAMKKCNSSFTASGKDQEDYQEPMILSVPVEPVPISTSTGSSEASNAPTIDYEAFTRNVFQPVNVPHPGGERYNQNTFGTSS